MRKPLLITAVAAIILFALLFVWYFVSREEGEPLGDFVYDALPFGSGGGEDIPFIPPEELGFGTSTEGEGGSDTSTEEIPVASIFKLSDTPVAGAVIFARNGRQVARYIERATGHIYEVSLPSATSSSAEKVRITNTTIPKIYEAYFRADGNAVLTRTLREDTDAVENNALLLTPPTSTSTADTFHRITSTPIRGNMDSVAAAGNSLFYALRDASSIAASAFDGTGQRTLLSSAFAGWRLAAAGTSLIAYTKASAFAPGYAYSLNTTNGALTKVAGPLNGLVAVTNPAGNRLVYSYIQNGATRTFAKTLPSGEPTAITPGTLAEKCVWSATDIAMLYCGVPENGVGGGEPDNWYRGASRFSDRIWSFNTNTNISQVIAEPAETNDVEIDAIELKLSPNEAYLIFTNRNDYTLWALRLE